jgi:hypothetical protein
LESIHRSIDPSTHRSGERRIAGRPVFKGDNLDSAPCQSWASGV